MIKKFKTMKEVKAYTESNTVMDCAFVGYSKGEYLVKCTEKKVSKPVVKKVSKPAVEKMVEKMDADNNNHITKKEAVDMVKEAGSKKTSDEIIAEIDTNDNGRITKKEVREYFDKK